MGHAPDIGLVVALQLGYTQNAMTAIILVFCTGLLVYWTSRVFFLMRGPAERVNRLLEDDLLWGKSFINALRDMFAPVFMSSAI